MRMKRKMYKAIALLVVVFSLFFASAISVQAENNSWMATAKEVKINTIVKGVAQNNRNATLMDPWRSYQEYFYIYVPVKMNITLTLSVEVTQEIDFMLYNNRGNYLTSGGWSVYNRAENKNSSVLQRTCEAGEYYIRLTRIFNSSAERHPYSLKVQGELLNSVNIRSIRKVSATKAKITWKKVKGVTAYEIFRKGPGQKLYRKVATVNRKRTSFVNKGLKRKKKYYYFVRAYKNINGIKVYSKVLVAKGIRM